MTAQGRARSVFYRAIERRNLLVAEATARDRTERPRRGARSNCAHLRALTGALQRASSRSLRIYVDERPGASTAEIAFVSGALADETTRPAAAEALATLVRGRL